jgi:beta-phosphoglucomutase
LQKNTPTKFRTWQAGISVSHPIVMKINRDFQAYIFDFDGVVVDSEPLHAIAKRNTLDRFLIQYPPTLMADFKGRTDIDFFAYVSRELALGKVSPGELGAYKQGEYIKLFEDVPLVPGIQEFIRFSRKQRKQLGLATSATGRDFSLAAEKYQLQTWFDVIITGYDTKKHKPDPEPYLKAISKLSVLADNVMVIEDSPNGIRSARSANCTIVAITTSFTSDELYLAGADLVVKSFHELELELK